MALLDFLFGGGTQTVKQKYEYSPPELGLIAELQRYLGGGQAFSEGRRFLAPEISGYQRQARQLSAPYGGGAEISAGLKAGSSINDLIAQYGLQRQGESRGLLASLVGGKGTQISETKMPPSFGGLGQLIGYWLAMQGMPDMGSYGQNQWGVKGGVR